MKHVNYLSFFLLALFSISFISCSDDDDNKLNTGITNQSWTEGKSLEISQDNDLSVSFNAAAKWVASVTSGADWCKLNTTSGTKGQSTLKLSVSTRDYENGFTPDIEIDENDPYGRGDGYYIYRDYGSDKEFLYARAIQEITGQAPAPTTRSAEPLMRGKALKVPAIYRRGHEGMIKLPE